MKSVVPNRESGHCHLMLQALLQRKKRAHNELTKKLGLLRWCKVRKYSSYFCTLPQLLLPTEPF
jgi:hypothetical protein